MRRYTLIIILLITLISCRISNRQFFYDVIKYNINSVDIKIVKCDILYQNWISESLNKKHKFSYGVRITDSVKFDTSFVREYYSKNIYFQGKILKNHKYGYWNGFFKNLKIINTAYIGKNLDSPAFVDIINKKGKYKHYQFNTIE